MKERREVAGRSAQHGERATTERERRGERGRQTQRERERLLGEVKKGEEKWKRVEEGGRKEGEGQKE